MTKPYEVGTLTYSFRAEIKDYTKAPVISDMCWKEVEDCDVYVNQQGEYSLRRYSFKGFVSR